MSARQPVLFLSHGAPPLADDATWTGQLHAWSDRLEKPTSILMVSAHWENQPVTVSSTRPGTPKLLRNISKTLGVNFALCGQVPISRRHEVFRPSPPS